MKARGRKPRGTLRLTRLVGVRGLDIPPMETIADVRRFLRHVPENYRQTDAWQYLEGQLDSAEASGETKDATVALQMVLAMNGLLST